MRLSLRFILPLMLILGVIAYFVTPLVDSLTLKWFVRDLDIRSHLISNTIQEPLIDLVKADSRMKIMGLFNRAIQDERLYALGFCNSKDNLTYKTETFPAELECSHNPQESSGVIRLSPGSLHVSSFPVMADGNILGHLVLVHDMSFIERRSADTKSYILYLFLCLGLIISLITVIIAQLSWRGWVSGMQSLLRGEGIFRPTPSATSRELMPLERDLRTLIQSLESERRAKDEGLISWTPQALKRILNEDLSGDEILIVSNREPYIHTKKNQKIEIQVPASGVVTALEPIMRACSGTWVAHGGGSGDRDVVDKNDRVQVPPNNPSYSIRRVWLSKEEEQGYYYGFANEGIWPLCHIAHTRPIFRTSDWNQYVKVNEKFAAAIFQEVKTDDPVILVQDYHFALLPRLIRKRLPEATIVTFWHIPWPNPEAFGICPWREEILDGLFGSSILGFHTRFHCNNFIDTVDRFLETRIDRETSTISYGGKLTAVEQYPISIEWPPRWVADQKPVSECRLSIRKRNQISEDTFVGIGVDRMDYTKGILERFFAIERLFEKNPEWVGRFCFVQIAAPTRSSIEQYQNFEADVRSLARRINSRFGKEGYEPICLKVEHHEPDQVYEYYRGADLCMVTSLHDGMNLVAKEFAAARDDERGCLILSQFTGAARELPEALLVNPYNIDQCADAIERALRMSPKEQRERMRSMRGLIQEFNVYRWAGRMLMDAGRMRQRNRLFGQRKDLIAFKDSRN